jgi:hypothetical protein
MSIEQRVTAAAHEVADRVSVPMVDADAVRVRARRERRRTVVTSVGALAVAVSAVIAIAVTRAPDPQVPQPVKPPGLIVGEVPVWYDASGLHRGDVVEQTAVNLFDADRPRDQFGEDGVLTLVRRGALYRDPATDDVWFHPWGGQPRIVGRGSLEGPSGDPRSDVAAWFEGSELVVYDTAVGRELSRTLQSQSACSWAFGEGQFGNGFEHVSATEVVWRACNQSLLGVWTFDVASGTSTEMSEVSPDGSSTEVTLDDVHDGTLVYWYADGNKISLMVSATGTDVHTHFAMLPGRLSPDGAFMVSPLGSSDRTDAAAVVVDVRTGEEWRMWEEFADSVSWSYGNVALAFFDPQYRERSGLRACHAITHECELLAYDGSIVLPQS